MARARIYHALRNQLGSIRNVYLRGNTIERRDDFSTFSETVLLLHGFFQTRNIWEVMETRLRRDGYGVLSLNLGGLLWRYNTRSIYKQGAFLAEKMEAISHKYGLKGFHVVGHSMGGLVARHYIQRHGGDRRVKSLVTLGTPHHGTPTALLGVALMGGGLLSTSPMQMLPRSKLLRQLHEEGFPPQIPLTSIYSKQDLICPWWASVLHPSLGEKEIRSIELRGVGHSELTAHPRIYNKVREHLERASALWEEKGGHAEAPGGKDLYDSSIKQQEARSSG